MRSVFPALIAAAAIVAGPCGACEGATYHLRPLTISGSASVSATAINGAGVVVGIFKNSEMYSGFYGRPGNIETLAPPAGATSLPVPIGINDSGVIIGYYYSGTNDYGFVFSRAQYVSAFSLGSAGNTAAAPFIAAKGYISFNYYSASGIYTPCEWLRGTTTQLQLGNFATISSVNSNGDASGEFQTFSGNTTTTAVFLTDGSTTKTLLPPTATASFGGFVNDSRAVAGTYYDPSHIAHAFKYAHGTYSLYNAPKLSTKLTVQGIDEDGRIVGVFADSSGQHAFVINSGKLTSFGNWLSDAVVHVSISDHGGRMAVSVLPPGAVVGSSYLTRCEGSGC
jgi:hypothetical protein